MDGHRSRTAAIATTTPFHNYPDVNNIAQYKRASYPGTPTPRNAFQQQCLHGQRQRGDKLLTFTRHIPLLLTLFCLFSFLLISVQEALRGFNTTNTTRSVSRSIRQKDMLAKTTHLQSVSALGFGSIWIFSPFYVVGLAEAALFAGNP
jgi:hypothetical protein